MQASSGSAQGTIPTVRVEVYPNGGRVEAYPDGYTSVNNRNYYTIYGKFLTCMLELRSV